MTKPLFADRKADTVRSFAAFTRGEIAVPSHPLELYLEISSLCNARCVMCGVFSAFNPDRIDIIHGGQRAHMGMLEVDKLLEDEELFSHALWAHLNGFGEPTIHPRFRDILRALGRFEIVMEFFTNGMKFSEELIDTLIETNVERVTFSFSGVTKEFYENVYIGCTWEKVLGSMRRLAERKAKLGKSYPEIHINSLAYKEHLQHLDEFLVLMADHGVQHVDVKQLHACDATPEILPHIGFVSTEALRARVESAHAQARRLGTHLNIQPEVMNATRASNPMLVSGKTPAPDTVGFLPIEGFKAKAATVSLRNGPRRAPPRKAVPKDADSAATRELMQFRSDPKGFQCMEPFKTLFIRQDGLVKPCCLLHDGATMLGDSATQSPHAIWQGPGFAAMREGALTSDYPDFGCGQCLRSNDGPEEHFAELQIARYGRWFRNVFGVEFVCDAGIFVRDSRTIAALQRARLEGEGPPTSYQGFLDAVSDRRVDGWVWSSERPDLRHVVSIWADGLLIGKTVADEPRSDVLRAGIGDGRYGFSYDVPSGRGLHSGAVVAVTVGRRNVHLTGSPSSLAGSSV